MMTNKSVIFPALLLLIFNISRAQVTFTNNRLSIENDKMIQVLSFQNHQVQPISIFSKELNQEFVDTSSKTPWFEFVINKKLLKSSDPIWKYQSYQIRKLNNGGEEVSIFVEAIKLVKGLQLEILRQYFPGSTLIREQLILKTSGKSFTLSKLNGMLHFFFPRYELKSSSSVAEVKEIRIATFDNEILDSYNPKLTYDDRKADRVGDNNLGQCHMFHPKINL